MSLERSRRRGIAAAGFILAAAVIGGAALMSRGPDDSDYFGPNEPTWVRVPTTLGDPVYLGVRVLHARPGDTIVLQSLIPERLLGDPTVVPIGRMIDEPATILGAIAESDLGQSIDLASYGPVPLLSFSEADGAVELAVKVTGTTPLHGFDGIRVRFTLNGASKVIEDWIPLRASICTGSTSGEAVDRCRPIVDEMHSQGL